MLFMCRHCNEEMVSLTSRQHELMMAFAAAPAATNRELGEKLCMSEWTVKKHFAAIYRAIGAQNRSECLVMWLRKESTGSFE